MRRYFFTSIIAFAAALLLPLSANAAVDSTTVLPSGDGLAPGDRVSTERTRLVMQGDGDLVFSARTNSGWKEIWASETGGHPGAYVLMQLDGNLVVYSPKGEALWHAGTFNHPGAYLQLEDRDRRLVLYEASGVVLWVNGVPSGPPPPTINGLDPGDTLSGGQTVASPRGRTVLRMLNSGNAALTYKRGLIRRRLWSSDSSGSEGARMVMQDDGNLVIYAIGGEPVWNSGTVGNPGAYLRLLDEGKAILYAKDGRILWINGRLHSTPPPPKAKRR